MSEKGEKAEKPWKRSGARRSINRNTSASSETKEKGSGDVDVDPLSALLASMSLNGFPVSPPLPVHSLSSSSSSSSSSSASASSASSSSVPSASSAASPSSSSSDSTSASSSPSSSSAKPLKGGRFGPTGIVYDERCLAHQANYSHPENPKRMSVTMEHLQSRGLYERCVHVPARLITTKELEATHTPLHVKRVADTEHHEYGEAEPDSETEGDEAVYPQCLYFDNDTFANQHSYTAARLSCGGLVDLCEKVVDGELRNGFAVVRPPGHHAEEGKPMGFCLFNNVAVATNVIRKSRPRVKKVLIVDWDVHHGNGTQNLFFSDPDVLYFSIHRYQDATFYPHTGGWNEVGEAKAAGRTVNVPLPVKQLGDVEYLTTFQKVLIPIAMEFQPDLVIISAGFDCCLGDPLGGMEVSPEAFAYMTSMLMNPAVVKDGRVVLALEGGYNVRAVSESIGHCVSALLGDPLPPLVNATEGFESKRDLSKRKQRHGLFMQTIDKVISIQKTYWKSLRRPALIHALSHLSLDEHPSKAHDHVKNTIYAEAGVTVQVSVTEVPVLMPDPKSPTVVVEEIPLSK